MTKIAMFTARIIFVASAAVVFGAAPLHAQGTASPAEPNAVFIPQAQPGQAKPAAPARKAAPKAAPPQYTGTVPPGATVGALPNHATAISETYGDWTLNCGTDKGAKFCTLSQAQVNKEGQRAFAVELRTAKDGSSEGTILMPFGLKLDAGAILKIDDKDLGQGVRFSTCVPQGCLLPISFPTVATDAMRKGKTLVVASLNLSSGQAVSFNVSLSGFAAALDRTLQLGR